MLAASSVGAEPCRWRRLWRHAQARRGPYGTRAACRCRGRRSAVGRAAQPRVAMRMQRRPVASGGVWPPEWGWTAPRMVDFGRRGGHAQYLYSAFRNPRGPRVGSQDLSQRCNKGPGPTMPVHMSVGVIIVRHTLDSRSCSSTKRQDAHVTPSCSTSVTHHT